MSINYIIKVKNRFEPLQNAITTNNIQSFYKLFENKDSKFRKWYDDEVHQLIGGMIDKYGIDTLTTKYVNKYCNTNVNDLINKNISPNGQIGGNTKKDHLGLIIGMIHYLFSYNNIGIDALNKINQRGGASVSLNDKSGVKKKERLVYFVQYIYDDGRVYDSVLKITRPTEYFKKEGNIYAQLNEIAKTETL